MAGAARRTGLAEGIPAHQRSLFGLGVAFATYGLAVLTPHGNGLIAVYVAAIVARASGARTCAPTSSARPPTWCEIVKLGIFVVFGAAAHAVEACSARGGRRSGWSR